VGRGGGGCVWCGGGEKWLEGVGGGEKKGGPQKTFQPQVRLVGGAKKSEGGKEGKLHKKKSMKARKVVLGETAPDLVDKTRLSVQLPGIAGFGV